jgi:hypothetical protein
MIYLDLRCCLVSPVARDDHHLTAGVRVSSDAGEQIVHHEKPRRFASSRASERDMLFG